jgi:hypothetical protein
MRSRYFSILFRLGICVIGAVVIGMAYYALTKPMAVRQALPLRAVVAMHEHYQDSAPLPDFVHCVRTEITSQDFKLFVARMKLVPYRGVRSFPSCEAKWWAASADSSGAFFNPENDEQTQAMAKFENGTLYYVNSVP